MSELLLLGTSHKTAPLAVRERVALPEGRAERFLLELAEHPEIREAVVLSTCNRTELYVVVSDPVEAETTVLGMLARQAGLRPTELIDGIYSLRNCDAARHLYRVTSGLESMIVGEAEVQGQVKRAYEAALAARTTGPLTNKLFRAALATGKRVRTDTAIGAGGASVASVAVEAARGALGELASRHVLIIGAGETAELTARALSEQGVSTMFVANRRRERAMALAQRFGGSTIAFDALPGELERADIVVASTASPHSIVGAEELALVTAARGGRPLLLLDLAVPRDIDPDCAALPGVTLVDIDGLQAQVARTHSERRIEARRAEGIVEEEIQGFAGWLGTLEVLPTIAALREQADRLVAELLAENEQRWESMSERDRERVEAMLRAAVKRLLHEPTQRVKALDSERRHARLSLLRELFGLDAPEAGERPAAEVRQLPCARRRSRLGAPALSPVRLGTRGSALALAQARWVAERLPGEVVVVELTTAGDLQQGVGDKSRWTGALERALVAGEIDIAVHSAKDVPGELADGTEIVAVPPRADPRDVLVGASSLDALPERARVGTSALRRQAQLLALRPDLDVVELRGNVDTRLRKLAAGEVEALVLAAAGLARLGRDDVAAAPLEGPVFVPAPGQGCLAVQARTGDRFESVDDPAAHAALLAERAVVARLDASCHTPVGVHSGPLGLRGFVGLPDGSEWLIDDAPDAAGLAERMLAAGAADLLARAEASA